MWNAVAVFAGLMVGAVVNMGLVAVSGTLFPAPAGADLTDAAQLHAYIGSLPTAAFLLVMAAHLAQAFVGGAVAAKVATGRAWIPAMIVGALSMVGGLINLATLPGPAWMWVEVPLYLVASGAAAALVARLSPAGQE
jgi:hypothetical protein